MPKIIIREKDNTTAPASNASNFTVLVPGFYKKASGEDNIEAQDAIFDENGVAEFDNAAEFKKWIIGSDATGKDLEPDAEADNNLGMGAQIAYELLSLGYPVLYKKIGDITEGSAVFEKTINDISWWAPLADRSAYDFRYVITGLLKENTAANNAISQLASAANSYDIKEEDVPTAIGEYYYGRGDCTALVDIDENKYLKLGSQGEVIKAIQTEACALSQADKYTAIFAPTICYVNTASEAAGFENKRFPASFHYLACARQSRKNNFAEWYAVAGMTRGVCNLAIDSVSVKLGEPAINSLEPRHATNISVSKQEQVIITSANAEAHGYELREDGFYYKGGKKYKLQTGEGNTHLTLESAKPEADVIEIETKSENATFNRSVNIIAKIKKNYLLWGNRTAHALGVEGSSNGDLVASHFLNIRQLCTTIKKQLYIACRRFTFDQNSDILWNNVVNAIKPTLNVMKNDQGIESYKIIKVPTNQKAMFKAKISIVPIEAVEDFDITLALEDSASGINPSTGE